MKFTTKLPGMCLYPGAGIHWWESITSQEMVDIARRADELGFDYIQIPYHLAMNHESAQEMGPRWVHSLAAAGFVLGATSRITVCPMVVVPQHQPIELGKALSTLDYVSGGRMVPLLLVGYQRWEFDLMRAPYEARGKVTDEYVEAMIELWTNDNPVYHGEFVDFEDVVFDPRPAKPMELWFGGRTKGALARIARLGDGWVSYSTSRARFREAVRSITEHPAFLERPRTLEVWLELFEGKRDPISHEVIEQPRVVFEKDAILEQIHQIAALGATMTSLDDLVGMGKFQNDQPGAPPPTRSAVELLERLHWAAEEILPEARAIEASATLEN